MVSLFLFGIFTLFLIMAHSTLLFFKGKEDYIISMKDFFFPWPSSGKLVSILCMVICLLCLWLLFILPFDLSLSSVDSWKILMIMIVFPGVIYMNYLIRRLRIDHGKIFFHYSDITHKEAQVPIFLSVGISFFLWLFFS
jgi:hypothetical protein